MTDQQRQNILDFFKSQPLAALATVHADGTPAASLIAFSETNELELIFNTSSEARKFDNLLATPRVALVIGCTAEKHITLQYEGVARKLFDNEVAQYREMHIAKNPFAKKYADDPNQRWFIVKPRWIRFSDTSVAPENVFEVVV